MPRTKERSCGTKRQYSTRHKAEIIARQMRNRDNPRLGPYRCVFCKFYHIGHSTTRPAQPVGDGS